LIAIEGVGHYLHAVHDGEALPSLTERLEPLCREKFRRIDRFIQLALLGSAECVRGKTLAPDCALYICSGLGPVGNNIVVQEAIIRNRVLPTPFHFVNTLGSSAGYYVARNLGLTGQSLFVSRRGGSFEAGLACAATDLVSGAVSQVLLGVVEECTLPLADYRARQELPADAPAAEGSHWLLLRLREGQGAAVAVPAGAAAAAAHDSPGAARLTGFVAGAGSGTFGFVAADDRGEWSLARALS
jgi:hypothetical protein